MGLKYRVSKYYDSFEDIANDKGSGGGSSDSLIAVSYSETCGLDVTNPEGQYFSAIDYIYIPEDGFYTCGSYGQVAGISTYEELKGLTQLDLDGVFTDFLDVDFTNLLVVAEGETEDNTEAIFKIGSKVSGTTYNITLLASQSGSDDWEYVDKNLYRMVSSIDEQEGISNDNYVEYYFMKATPYHVDDQQE